MYLMEDFHKSKIAATGLSRELGGRGAATDFLKVRRRDSKSTNYLQPSEINKVQSVGLEASLEWLDAQVNRSAHALSTSASGGPL